jgi:hypothetical protein
VEAEEEESMNTNKYRQGQDEWVKSTILFQYGIHVIQQIQRFRCMESEKAGHDIGLDRAVVNWTVIQCQPAGSHVKEQPPASAIERHLMPSPS